MVSGCGYVCVLSRTLIHSFLFSLEDNYSNTALARAVMEREETKDQDLTKKENLKEIVDSLLRHPQVETSVFNNKKKKK